MRKSLIITIAAALLLAAVICTAGCVDTKTTDPAVGDWFADDDESLTVLSVYEDGTGAYVVAKAKVLASGETGYVKDEERTFIWAKNADGTYLISFADGDTSTAEVNTQRGILTLDDGSRFEKQASELSGASSEGRTREVMDNETLVEIKMLKEEIQKLEDKRQNLEGEIKKIDEGRTTDDDAAFDKMMEMKMELKSLEKEIKKLEAKIDKLEEERKKPDEEQME